MRGAGMCTAGAFYFLNEADIVICSPEATFFDSHVTYGMVSALEPVGLMRRIGLARDAAHRAVGQRRAGDRGDRVAHRARDARSSSARPVGARARDRRVDRGEAERGDAGNGACHLGVARPAVPRRDGAGPDLHAARQPVGHGGGRRRRPPGRRRGTEAADDAARCPTASPRSWQSIRLPMRSSSTASWRTWGELGATVDDVAALIDRPGLQVGILLRNRPSSIGLLLGVLRAGGCVVTINPGRGVERTATTSRRSTCPFSPASHDDLEDSCTRGRAVDHRRDRGPRRARSTSSHAGGTSHDERRAWCRRAHAHQRHDRTTEADRPHVRNARARAGRGQALRGRPARPHCGSARRCGRELAARASRWSVPGAASASATAGRSPARAVHRRRLGRRGAPAPARDGEPRPDRAAHGARGGRRSRRPRQPSLGRVRHGAARSRRCRRVHCEVRRACAGVVCGDGVRWRRRGMEHRGPPRVLGDQAGERRPRPRRLRAAGGGAGQR